jgi:hypothetical protein
MPDGIESTRFLSRVVCVCLALRHEPERNICRVMQRLGVSYVGRNEFGRCSNFKHGVRISYFVDYGDSDASFMALAVYVWPTRGCQYQS